MDDIRAIHISEYAMLLINGEEAKLTEVMADWRSILEEAHDPNLRIDVDSITVDGDEAIVDILWIACLCGETFPAFHYLSRIETACSDHWTKSSAGWRLRHSKIQESKSWINDKLEHTKTQESPLTEAEHAAVIRDLREYAHPLGTVLAGNTFDDLEGLDRLIGNARIVALGEASHGTAECFQMKHRLLEYLVEKKGFTVFAIEGNWLEATIADRFIKTGEGDAATR